MSLKLFIQALIKFISGILMVALLIFLPAGSLSYTYGWLFMGVLFVPIFIAGILMMFKNPELLKKRLNAKEKQNDQSLVVRLSGLMFLAGFIVAGLGYRFGWYLLPEWAALAASAVFLFSYILYAEVMRENTYLSRTEEELLKKSFTDTASTNKK